MQISPIAISLKELASADPMAGALAEAGLVGGLHYGVRASRTAGRPFATFSVDEIDREYNSSGVTLVTYTIALTVYVSMYGELASAILGVFHRYWDRLAELPALDSDLAEFVLIVPEGTEIGEAEIEDLGKDVMIGVTSWTLRIAEHQPEIVED